MYVRSDTKLWLSSPKIHCLFIYAPCAPHMPSNALALCTYSLLHVGFGNAENCIRCSSSQRNWPLFWGIQYLLDTQGMLFRIVAGNFFKSGSESWSIHLHIQFSHLTRQSQNRNSGLMSNCIQSNRGMTRSSSCFIAFIIFKI